MKLYMFQTVRLSIIRSVQVIHFILQWYMSYRCVDSFRAGPGWNCISILVLLESCLQTCMAYTTAECTVNNSYTPDDGQTNCPKNLEFHAKINL